jgi:hypothetical protein
MCAAFMHAVSEIRDDNLSLDDLSDNDDGAVAVHHHFRKFLKEVDGSAAEFECYLRMADFRFGPPTDDNPVTVAQAIVDQYVRAGAAEEVSRACVFVPYCFKL